MKVVINACFGGFSLSKKLLDEYNKRTGKSIKYDDDILRSDPVLVALVEEMGGEANGASYTELKVVEIPDGVLWQIQDYDGAEEVAELHRTWS